MIVTVLGGFVIGLIIFYVYINSLPALSLWHTTILKNEFNSDSKVKNIDDNMALEKKLFAQMQTEVYDKIPLNKQNSISNPKAGFKELEKIDKKKQKLAYRKIIDLENGIFTTDKTPQGKHDGNYRIVYIKKDNILLMTLSKIAQRKEVYEC